MIWLRLTAVLLLPAIWWWGGLPPLWDAVEMAVHYAEEGQHCDDLCTHVHTLVKKPQQSSEALVDWDARIAFEPLFVGLAHDGHAHDRPPPLLGSPSHCLRAPPTLIPA